MIQVSRKLSNPFEPARYERAIFLRQPIEDRRDVQLAGDMNEKNEAHVFGTTTLPVKEIPLYPLEFYLNRILL